MADTLTLADVADRTDILDVACDRCERRGRLSVRRLVAEHGADASLPAVLASLTADCPHRNATAWFERCDVRFPGLPALFLSPGARSE